MNRYSNAKNKDTHITKHISDWDMCQSLV